MPIWLDLMLVSRPLSEWRLAVSLPGSSATTNAFSSGGSLVSFSRTIGTDSFSTGIDGLGFLEPYKNVFRMHLLIFFFLAAFLFHWQSAAVFVVVYAVYFLPWELLKRTASGGDPARA